MTERDAECVLKTLREVKPDPRALITEHLMCIIYDTQLHLGETPAHRHDQHALCSFTFPFCVALNKTICSPKDMNTSDEGNVQFVATPHPV